MLSYVMSCYVMLRSVCNVSKVSNVSNVCMNVCYVMVWYGIVWYVCMYVCN